MSYMGFEYSSYNEFVEQLNTKISVYLSNRIHCLPEKIVHIIEGSSNSFLIAIIHISTQLIIINWTFPLKHSARQIHSFKPIFI